MAARVVLDAQNARGALQIARDARDRALQRAGLCERVSWGSVLAAAMFAAAARLAVPAGALGSLCWAAAALAIASAGWSTWRARAARRTAQATTADVLALEVVVDALEHDGGPPAIVVPATLLTEPLAPSRSAPTVATTPGSGARWRSVGLALAAAVSVLILLSSSGERVPAAQRWTFTEPVEDPGALGLSTSAARSGPWQLEHHADATGARALVNRLGSADAPPATALTRSMARDVRVTTRCRSLAETAEQACGVVFRWADERHHYVARLDASAGTVSVALVFAGRERTLGVQPMAIAQGRWHDLTVEARGDHLTIEVDGIRALAIRDPSLPNAGRSGLWSPAAGAAHFDELHVVPLEPVAHPHELLPFLLWTQDGRG